MFLYLLVVCLVGGYLIEYGVGHTGAVHDFAIDVLVDLLHTGIVAW